MARQGISDTKLTSFPRSQGVSCSVLVSVIGPSKEPSSPTEGIKDCSGQNFISVTLLRGIRGFLGLLLDFLTATLGQGIDCTTDDGLVITVILPRAPTKKLRVTSFTSEDLREVVS